MATTIQQIELPKKARALDTSSSLQPIGGNLLAGSGFEGITQAASTSGAIWVTGVGWTIGSGVASCDGSQSASSNMYNADDDLLDPENKFWEITFTVTAYTAGNIRAQIGGYGPLTEERDATGTYTEIVGPIHSSSQNRLYLKASSDFIGSVDNVIVKEAINFNNNNHGQIYSGRGLEFDGVSDYLTTGEVFQSTFRDSHTISFWIKPDDGQPAAYMSVLGARDATGTDSRVYFNIQTNGKISFYYEIEGTFINAETASAVFTNGAQSWHRVVGVVNNTTNQMHVYVNGVDQTLDGTNDGDIGSTDLSNYTSVKPLFIGGASNDGLLSNIYAGLISDVQIWNTAWSAADVTYDYLNPESLALNNSGTALTESNLKLWYPMQDGHRGQQSYILDGANTGLGVELANFADGNITFSNDGASVASSNSLNSYNAVGDGSTNDARPRVSFALTTGQTYKIEYTPTLVLDDGVLDFFVGGSRLISNNDINTSFTKTFTSAAGHEGFDFDGSQAFNVDFTLSIKAINDKNHATTVFYGDELVTNGDFADNTPSDTWDGSAQANLSGTWTALGTHTSANHFNIVGGECRVRHDGGTASGIGNTTLLTTGRTYTVSFEIISVDSGAIKVYIGGNSTSFSTTGIKTITDVATSASFSIYRSGACDIIFDDVSVKEVGVASGWTDADQQLYIPQTALQSYNELLHGYSTEASGSTHVIIADNAALDVGEDDFSLSLWFKTDDDYDGYTAIYRKGGWGSNGYSIAINSSGKLALNTATPGTGNNLWGYTNTTIEKGKWYHVVGVWDRSANQTLYLNGVEQTMASNYVISGMTDSLNNTSSVTIHGSSSGRFTGCITEVALFKTIVLSDAEVLELYNDGKALDALTHSQVANLTGYWRNNGLSTWNDLSTNSNNGTVTGTETILIPQGVDSTRDNQGFIMNKQKDTSSLNLPRSPESGYNGSYINIPSFDFHATTMSMSFWIKARSLATNATILDKYVTSGNKRALRLYINSSEELTLQLSSTGTDYEAQSTTDANLAVDTWYHIAITYSSGTWLVYKDTNAVSLDAAAFATTTSIEQNTTTLLVGGSQGGKDQFDGVIDNLLIYNDVLTSAEVERNYNATKGNHRN